MALWTPYAEEALDLTKPIKKEPHQAPLEYSYQPVYHYPGYSEQFSPASVYSYESYYPLRPSTLSPPDSPQNENGFPEQQVYAASPYEVRGYDAAYPIPSAAELERDKLCQDMDISRHREDGGSSDTSSRKRLDSLEVDSLSDDPDFQEFERDALRAMAEKNGGSLLGNNPRMRRAVKSNNESGDDSYRRQRERNNHAAKQSRDRRKLREIHLALKVSYLRREMNGLKARLAERVCARCQQSCLC